MRLRILAFTLLCAGFNVVSAASPASAEAPDPTFSISCTVGGETVLSWKHVRLTEVRLNWYNAAGSLVGQAINTNPRGLRLSLLTPTTVDDGGRVEAILLFVGGGGVELAPTTCTT